MPAAQAASCLGGAAQNDVLNSYGALLCANFSASCHWEARSGVTLPGLDGILDRTLGALATPKWDFSSFVPDAIVINLGENDWKNPNSGDPAWVAAWTASYVTFVKRLATLYNSPKITYFCTIGPHEAGQSAGIK